MPIAHRLIALLLLPLLALTAAEPLATFEKNSVEVVITYEPGEAGKGTLVGLFTPKPKKDPLHLYSVDLQGPEGVATTIAVRPGQAVIADGPLIAEQKTQDHGGLAVYPDGPVTVRLPVVVPPSADGAPVETTLVISYMACSARFCLNPVLKQPVVVKIPTGKAGAMAAAVPTEVAGAAPRDWSAFTAKWTKNQVEVVLSLEAGSTPDTAVLVGRFTPKPTGDPLHLYGKDLTGIAGQATRIAIKPGQAASENGPLSDDVKATIKDDVPVYPAGPMTLRLPIRLPAGAAGTTVNTEVLVSFMACTDKICPFPPVQNAVMKLDLPTAGTPPVAPPSAGGVDATTVRQIVSGALAGQKEDLIPEIRKIVATELDRLHEQASSAVRWRHPTSIAEIERLIDEAKKAGKPALLDFTGPSCVNCQVMDKTVFREPSVVAAWNRGVPIAINTDPDPRISDDFSAWQQKRFETQNRPLYVRIDPEGKETRWSEVFPPSDRATLALFIGFTEGGVGSDAGSGDGIGEFLLLAIFGGLFTLLMPCTYPMIPFTMTFFAKQAANGVRLLPLAAFYSFGIIACFVGIGVLITGVFGSTLSNLAGHPVTNLVIALLFFVLGLGLLGAFLIRLPSALENSLGGGRGGYLGALIMGLTFAVTAFSCTAPFAGAVLSQAVVTGSWTRAMVGMAVYASAIAIPFFALAMSPGLLKKLPKAGSWMNEFKVVGGLVELAAALKFLVICDVAWEWGIVGRSFTLASWSAVSLVIGVYVLGKLRFSGDSEVPQVGVSRLMIALAFIALGIWFASGLAGNNLSLFESFFPADPVPGA
jgi:thiol:disulfide interchange protein